MESVELDKDKVNLEPVLPEDLPVRRKRTAEMVNSYDWTSHLVEPGFCAAPVACFRHVSFYNVTVCVCVLISIIYKY